MRATPPLELFKLGQHVLKKAVLVGNATTNKFKERFLGPFEVVKVNLNGVTYQIRDCVTNVITRAHHGQLRIYVEVPVYLKRHPYYQALLRNERGQSPVETEKLEESVVCAAGGVDGLSCSSTESSGYDSDGCSTGSFSECSLETQSIVDWRSTPESESDGESNGTISLISLMSARTSKERGSGERIDCLPDQEDRDLGRSWQAVCSREENPLLMEFPHDIPENYYSFFIPEAEFSYDPVAHNLFNASGTIIDRERELSPGVLVERDEEFWEMGSVLDTERDFAVRPRRESVSGDYSSFFGRKGGSSELKDLRLSSSPSASFEPIGVGSLGEML